MLVLRPVYAGAGCIPMLYLICIPLYLMRIPLFLICFPYYLICIPLYYLICSPLYLICIPSCAPCSQAPADSDGSQPVVPLLSHRGLSLGRSAQGSAGGGLSARIVGICFNVFILGLLRAHSVVDVGIPWYYLICILLYRIS